MNEELENERLRREKDAESEKARKAAEDAREARESAEQYLSAYPVIKKVKSCFSEMWRNAFKYSHSEE